MARFFYLCFTTTITSTFGLCVGLGVLGGVLGLGFGLGVVGFLVMASVLPLGISKICPSD